MALAYRTGGAEIVAPWYAVEAAVELGGGGGGGGAGYSSETVGGGGGNVRAGSENGGGGGGGEDAVPCCCCESRIRRAYGSSSATPSDERPGLSYEAGGANDGLAAAMGDLDADKESGRDSFEPSLSSRDLD